MPVENVTPTSVPMSQGASKGHWNQNDSLSRVNVPSPAAIHRTQRDARIRQTRLQSAKKATEQQGQCGATRWGKQTASPSQHGQHQATGFQMKPHSLV